ncbi:MAG: hydrocarbon binding protein (contains V4R domain) [Candidatus Altiarchaeota archaeon]|nr:hydrocarbon binding protein (contains V4R domain) [Candidatus Altiarchaeota archaeon]
MVIKRETYTDYEIEFAMREKEDFEKSMQALMDIVGATVSTLESVAGMGARAMSYMAGKNIGKRIGRMIGRKPDVETAIDALTDLMGDAWKIEIWKPATEKELVKKTDKGFQCKLLFRDCIVRQTLEREAIPQKGTMCYLTNGYVCGALEVMLGMRGKLDFLHSGNNACLKDLNLTREGV